MKALDLRDNILQALRKRKEIEAYPLAYNRFDLYHEQNTFWISPTHENPAFGYNKFFFRDVSGKVEVGLHIEKGYEMKEACKRPTELINADWKWHDSMVRLKRGEMDDLMKALSTDLEKPVRSVVSHQTMAEEKNRVFGYNVVKRDEVTDHQKFKSLDTLPKMLDKWDDRKWNWLNVYVFTRWTVDELSLLNTVDDLEDFYKRAFSPFMY